MKTVCLITPPSGFLLDQRVFPSLGVLKVAASLERAGHRVEHLDLSGVADYEAVVRRHVQHSAAEVYGITATTPQLPAAVRIADAIHGSLGGDRARTVLGGPHATLVKAAARGEKKRGVAGRGAKAVCKLMGRFDVIVCGDGEEAILGTVDDRLPPCLIDADDPDGPSRRLFMTPARLAEAPLPARHLLDLDSYHYTIDGDRATSLIAQLGCPFACAFCGGRASPSFRRARLRPTEGVVAEMRHLHETYGYTGFMFYDDELNVNKNVVGLMKSIKALGDELNVEWKLRGFVKAELLTDAQAEALRAAGFRWLLVGFESGSPRILENINKKATREDNTRALQICRRHGIRVKALMSLGHAGESAATVLDTRNWLVDQGVDDFDCTVITCYPGTPYYDEAVESAPGVWTFTARSGDRLHMRDVDFTKEQAYYKGRPGAYESFVWTDFLSAEELVGLRDELEADVRRQLCIPYNAGAPGVQYEGTMGQIPGHILRTTA